MVTTAAFASTNKLTKVLTAAAITLIGAAALIGCEQGQSTATSQPTVVHYSASWAKAYTSVAALKQDADLAVDGTIARIVGVTKESNNLIFTDYGLTVQSVAFNPHKAEISKEIVIHQTGGVVGNTRFEFLDNPLFHTGEHVVLFLQGYSPGHYFVIGGPTGRFRVQSGLVEPLSKDGIKFVGPMSEEAFLAVVRT